MRARALAVAEAAGPDKAAYWLPAVVPALKDSNRDVRLAAVRALAVAAREKAQRN